MKDRQGNDQQGDRREEFMKDLCRVWNFPAAVLLLFDSALIHAQDPRAFYGTNPERRQKENNKALQD